MAVVKFKERRQPQHDTNVHPSLDLATTVHELRVGWSALAAEMVEKVFIRVRVRKCKTSDLGHKFV